MLHDQLTDGDGIVITGQKQSSHFLLVPNPLDGHSRSWAASCVAPHVASHAAPLKHLGGQR